MYLAISGDQDIDKQDLIRLVGQYQIDALKLGVMYQQNEDNLGTKDESGLYARPPGGKNYSSLKSVEKFHWRRPAPVALALGSGLSL